MRSTSDMNQKKPRVPFVGERPGCPHHSQSASSLHAPPSHSVQHQPASALPRPQHHREDAKDDRACFCLPHSLSCSTSLPPLDHLAEYPPGMACPRYDRHLCADHDQEGIASLPPHCHRSQVDQNQ